MLQNRMLSYISKTVVYERRMSVYVGMVCSWHFRLNILVQRFLHIGVVQLIQHFYLSIHLHWVCCWNWSWWDCCEHYTPFLVHGHSIHEVHSDLFMICIGESLVWPQLRYMYTGANLNSSSFNHKQFWCYSNRSQSYRFWFLLRIIIFQLGNFCCL